MRLPAPCYRSTIWFASFAIWFVVLWFLSSGPLPSPPGPELPHIDKVLHFGFFFGGAGLLSAALYLRAKCTPNWPALIVTVTLVLAAVGMLDEWHQSWIPERSGNDGGDWLADAYGALAGALVFRRLHRFLGSPKAPAGAASPASPTPPQACERIHKGRLSP